MPSEPKMTTIEIQRTVRLLQERIAVLERQVQTQNGSKNPKNKRARVERDSDVEVSDVLVQRGKIKREHISDSEHEFTVSENGDSIKAEEDVKKPAYRKRSLRLTGAGKSNVNVVDRTDKSVQDLIDELEASKPGAKVFINKNIAAHKASIEAGTWKYNQCYQLHHQCCGATINGQFSRHQISPTCGYCISRKGGPCRILADGYDCERCSLHSQLCLTYEDLSHIYKRMESVCVISQPTLEKWPLLKVWLSTQTEQKVAYGLDLIEAHINDRTESVEHERPGVSLSRLYTCDTETKKKQKPMPRGWVSVFCDDVVVHRRNVPFINLLRFYHLLQAVTDGNSDLAKDSINRKGQVSHLCRPITGRYCWEPSHKVFETSDQNATRDHYCFTARRLCVCQPLCLYNREGSRFVQNLDPVLPQFAGWRPVGQNMKTRYTTAELGAVTNDAGGVSIMSAGPSPVIELD